MYYQYIKEAKVIYTIHTIRVQDEHRINPSKDIFYSFITKDLKDEGLSQIIADTTLIDWKYAINL